MAAGQPVVAVAEGQHVAATTAEETQPTIDGVDLVEVESQVEDVVLQLVVDRPGALVTDLAVQQV